MDSKNIDNFIKKIESGDRASLASAITLVESETSKDLALSQQLMKTLFKLKSKASFRLGISGAPGAGKSTFINQLGLQFIKAGHKVAVLAIDPSSEISKGSILGDKTRMEELSREDGSYIRPSSSRGFLGGVHPATRDTIRLCELAGYDIVIVETVGVGQSEAAVADLVDHFLLLALPGAGDELQGIKRGILERIDSVVVHKADQNNKLAAEIAEKQYVSALQILRGVKIPTYLASSTERVGITEVCNALLETWANGKESLHQRRLEQDVLWIEKYLHHSVLLTLKEKLENSQSFSKAQAAVLSGQIDVREASESVLRSILDFK
jgi:LAO/AO transport system kinase